MVVGSKGQRWGDDDGESTVVLRRALLTPVPFMVLVSGLFAILSGVAEGTGTPWSALSTVFGMIIGTIGVLRGYSYPLLLLLFGWAMWSTVLPDASHVGTSTSLAHTTYLLVCAVTLRLPLTCVVYVISVVSFYLVAPGGNQMPEGVAVDLSVLNLGIIGAGSALASLLSERARDRDALIEARTELELSIEVARVEDEVRQRARRVLHDDVISSLRAVADLRGPQPSTLRRACLDAIDAVRESGARR